MVFSLRSAPATTNRLIRGAAQSTIYIPNIRQYIKYAQDNPDDQHPLVTAAAAHINVFGVRAEIHSINPEYANTNTMKPLVEFFEANTRYINLLCARGVPYMNAFHDEYLPVLLEMQRSSYDMPALEFCNKLAIPISHILNDSWSVFGHMAADMSLDLFPNADDMPFETVLDTLI